MDKSGTLDELVSLQNQVNALRLKDNFGKQTFPEDFKKVLELVTKSNESVSGGIAKTLAENSTYTNKSLENLYAKRLGTMSGRGIKACYLLSPFSNAANQKKIGI